MSESTEPVSCTLAPSAVDERLARWRALLCNATERRALVDGVRLTLPGRLENEVRELAALEATCCAFLAIDIAPEGSDFALEIRSEAAGAAGIISALVGADV